MKRRTARVINDITQTPFGWEMMEAFRSVVELAQAHIDESPQRNPPARSDVTAAGVWLRTRGLWPLHDEEIAEYELWLEEYHPELAREPV